MLKLKCFVNAFDRMQYLELIILLFTFLPSASCAPVIPAYAITTPSQSWYSIGSTVTVACKEDFEMSGPTTMTCQTDGTWTESPKCKKIGNQSICMYACMSSLPHFLLCTYVV